MHNLNRDSFLLSELHGGLWHSTHPERFTGILQSGAILPEPNMQDSDRWKTSRGRGFYPYVRLIGGVSLFDFHRSNRNPIKLPTRSVIGTSLFHIVRIGLAQCGSK